MNGKKHFSANVIVLLLTFFVSSSRLPETLPYSIIGSILGLLITPDYDIKYIYIKTVINKLPVGNLWNLYWLPYALLFAHRKLSHNIVIGTFTRFIYLCLPVTIVLIVTNTISIINFNNIITIYIFWYIQDLSHYLLDSRLFKKYDD